MRQVVHPRPQTQPGEPVAEPGTPQHVFVLDSVCIQQICFCFLPPELPAVEPSIKATQDGGDSKEVVCREG